MQNKKKPMLHEPLFLKINKHIKQDLKQGPTIFREISMGSLRHSLICVFFHHNSSLFFYFTSEIFLLDFAGVNLTKWAIEYEDPVTETFPLSMKSLMLRL